MAATKTLFKRKEEIVYYFLKVISCKEKSYKHINILICTKHESEILKSTLPGIYSGAVSGIIP